MSSCALSYTSSHDNFSSTHDNLYRGGSRRRHSTSHEHDFFLPTTTGYEEIYSDWSISMDSIVSECLAEDLSLLHDPATIHDLLDKSHNDHTFWSQHEDSADTTLVNKAGDCSPNTKSRYSNSSEKSSRSENFDYSTPSENFDNSSPREKFDHSSPREKFDHSSPRETFDHSSPRKRFDYSSPREKFDHSSPREKFDHSSPREKFDHSSPREKFEPSTPSENFDYSTPRTKSDYSTVMDGRKYTTPTKNSDPGSDYSTDPSTKLNKSGYSIPLNNSEYSNAEKISDYLSQIHQSDCSSPQIVQSEYATPMKQSAFSTPMNQSAYSTPINQAIYSTPLDQSAYSTPMNQSAYSTHSDHSTPTNQSPTQGPPSFLQSSRFLQTSPHSQPTTFLYPEDNPLGGVEDTTLRGVDAAIFQGMNPQEKLLGGMNLSFAGCGFLGIYHVGVSACLRKYCPELLVNRISGASAGALAAACLLCDADLGVITSSVLKVATEARSRLLGPFSPTFNVEKLLREGLLSVLPDNAHEIVSGRLYVSVTRVSDGRNVLLSHFDTREELVQALLCSAFIPAFSGYRPLTIRGVRYVDGGFSDNLPELDQETVTVSPFCGEADICPTDNTPGFMTISLANTSIEVSRDNLRRFSQILFPPPPNILNKMCQQGFNDTLDFLQRNNLIACTKCVAVQSTLPVLKDTEEKDCYESLELDSSDYCVEDWEKNCPAALEDCDDCEDCRRQRQVAILDELPDVVVSRLEEAIQEATSKASYFASLSLPQRLVSLASLPVRVPYIMAKSVLSSMPSPVDLKGLHSKVSQTVEILRCVVLARRRAAVSEPASGDAAAVPHHRHPPHNHAQCNFAITEFSSRKRRGSLTDVTDGSDVETGCTGLTSLAEMYAAKSRAGSRAPSRAASRATSRATSRAASRTVSRRGSLTEEHGGLLEDVLRQNLRRARHDTERSQAPDTLGQLINVTKQQDALMAYYYLDENNQMQVTEIFDMSAPMQPDNVDTDTEALEWGEDVEEQMNFPTSEDVPPLRITRKYSYPSDEEDDEDGEEDEVFDTYSERTPSEPEADQYFKRM